MARITVQLRRAEQKTEDAVLTAGELILNPASQTMSVRGQEVKLTRTESAILKLLMTNPKQVVCLLAALAMLAVILFCGGALGFFP